MDVTSMLSNGGQDAAQRRATAHQYPTRNTSTGFEQQSGARNAISAMQRAARGGPGAAGPYRGSPMKPNQKHVVFQLTDSEDPRIQARLPMRVMISPHDTTESIITTVKNFYGLYEYGVSFENKDGFGIIAAYDNFESDMVVYVRTIAQPSSAHESVRNSLSPKKPALAAPIEMRPPQHSSAHSPSRTAARSAGVRSVSPQSELGRRSTSVAPNGKPRAVRTKSKDNSVMGDADGYSSGDNGGGSVTSSRRSKTEQVNAEISVDNIVEGGRRKHAFESSELPLFVPPQVPLSASQSSISPQRRAAPGSAISPYQTNPQHTFAYQQPLPSPRSYESGAKYMQPGMPASGYNNGYAANRQLRGRQGNVAYPPARQSVGGILSTPDPTVGSAISDEDVALQLMRLGDPTAFSHGRTSTSTVDDALSGKAELASSAEDSEEDDIDHSGHSMPAVPHLHDAGPQRKKQRTAQEFSSDITSGEEYEDRRDGTFDANGQPQRKMSKLKSNKPRTMSMAKPKTKPGSMSHARVPMSPSSLPAQSRKGSISSTFAHPLGADEEDLSAKPRCQRCRKSKKGCDRQRPCGRCKDAGIGVEGCVSEDESNGRKGRYGRHMGVPIKKETEVFGDEAMMPQPSVPANGYFLAPALPDKSKKRKR